VIIFIPQIPTLIFLSSFGVTKISLVVLASLFFFVHYFLPAFPPDIAAFAFASLVFPYTAFPYEW